MTTTGNVLISVFWDKSMSEFFSQKILEHILFSMFYNITLAKVIVVLLFITSVQKDLIGKWKFCLTTNKIKAVSSYDLKRCLWRVECGKSPWDKNFFSSNFFLSALLPLNNSPIVLYQLRKTVHDSMYSRIILIIALE